MGEVGETGDEIRVSGLAVCRRWDYWVRRISGGRGEKVVAPRSGAGLGETSRGRGLSETLI